MSAPLETLGKALVGAGAALAVVGLLLWGLSRLSGGRGLPGDVLVRRDGWTFYFPLATCVALSLLVSLILYIISAGRTGSALRR